MSNMLLRPRESPSSFPVCLPSTTDSDSCARPGIISLSSSLRNSESAGTGPWALNGSKQAANPFMPLNGALRHTWQLNFVFDATIRTLPPALSLIRASITHSPLLTPSCAHMKRVGGLTSNDLQCAPLGTVISSQSGERENPRQNSSGSAAPSPPAPLPKIPLVSLSLSTGSGSIPDNRNGHGADSRSRFTWASGGRVQSTAPHHC